jgi:thymidylate kinase
VILGPDGAGKSSVIVGLADHLSQSGLAARVRHLKPRMVAQLRGQQERMVVDPHGRPRRGVSLSLAKIVVWLIEEWCARLFDEPKGTLLLCDRYYHDLLVDPRRYRFGAPRWTADLIGRLMPQPDLWILLDAPAEVLQVRKQEVPLQETARQCEAYRRFVCRRRRHVIVDAAHPLSEVLAHAERAIRATITEYEGSRA